MPVRRSSLGIVLIALNVSLALMAVGGLAAAAAGLFRRFTDQQAFERVRQASSGAERGIAAEGEALLGLARALAARQPPPSLPDLQRLAADGLVSDAAFAREGRAGWFAAASSPSGVGISASAPLSDGGFVVVSRRLDAAVARRLSEQTGATVRIADAAAGIGEVGDPKIPMRAMLLQDNEPEPRKLDELGVYAAVRALRDPSGRVAAFVETEIPTLPARLSRQRLVEKLGVLAAIIGGLATIGSIAIARHIARPLTRLTESADRLGGGDLVTPVAREGSAEIGRLASSLEDMRRRLRALTLDLEAQKSDARAIVDGIVEGVFVVDGERRIVEMNRQAASLAGTTPEAAVGRFCGDVLYPESVKGGRPCEESCPILDARFRGNARAVEHLAPEGGRRRTVVVSSSTSGGARQVQLMRDETEVEAARRLRDAVLANISHEFKTPLAAQLASLEVLVDRFHELAPEEARKLIVSLQRGSLRLSHLIDNLLESVRLEAGRLVLRKQTVHLDEVVEEAVEMIRPLADQRGQTIEVALPHPLPAIPGDAPRLVQVFVNLLANAAKFAPERTPLRVGGQVEPAQVTLYVEDEGPGWSDEADDQIFEPFVRSSAGEPDSSGVGLGLHIAKAIVERHGGTIEARSRGGRTRVTLTLPVAVLA